MFTPDDIKSVMNGTASRGTVFAVLTSQTCGENCWHAREEICRCSCGGKNHGCLTHDNGTKPDRTSKIDGHLYKLKAVGIYRDVISEAREINRLAGYSYVDKPIKLESGDFHQYRYTWSETDCGAPARIKTVTDSQRKWAELSGWTDNPNVRLLWVRVTMPIPPSTKVVDRETGEPLVDQLPPTY